MIKLEALRVFIAVAETGNIREAGEQLHRTPSAISMTLKQLETNLGAPLFQSDRKNSLTPLGRFALETARLQVETFDRCIESMRAFAHNRIGRLSVAAVPSVAAILLPAILSAFLAERPGVEIELIDTDSRQVCDMVASGQADIGIGGVPHAPNFVMFEPIFTDRFMVVCQGASSLAHRGRALRWGDIADQPLIRNGAAVAIHSPDYRALSAAASLTVRNVTSLLAVVQAGSGITLLPELATRQLPHGVVALPLEDESVVREVGLINRRQGSPNPLAEVFHNTVMAAMPMVAQRTGQDRS